MDMNNAIPSEAIAQAIVAAHVDRSEKLENDSTAIDLVTHPMGQIVTRLLHEDLNREDAIEVTVSLFNFSAEDTDRWTY